MMFFLLPFGSFLLYSIPELQYLRVWRHIFLLPFGSFGRGFGGEEAWQMTPYLSTPFWEFPVRVLFKIFLSLSLKVFMKVIGTFVIS